MSNGDFTIGLVAIGRNEGERLKRCLRSAPPHIPIVYVDSASTDDSVAFALTTQATVVELDMDKPFSAARARNEGISTLLRQYPGLAFIQVVDGDCEIETDWIACAASFLESQTSVAAVCGRRRERYPDASIYNRMCDDEWDTPIGEAKACGGDALLRVVALQQVGTYDPVLIAGEEPELCQRLRAADWKIWRLDAPMTIHDADMHNFGQYWKRAIRCGFGSAQVLHKTGSSPGDTMYRREVGSALLWTFGVASFAVLSALIFGAIGLVAAPVIWLIQLARLKLRYGATGAIHILAGKIAETTGVLRFVLSRLRGRNASAIFYK